ncbi:FAD-binding domain-containing protein, partial [Zopfia rhizophila CBS 207.26]
CTALSNVLREKVAYPTNSTYTTPLNSYFSFQESSLTPNCIVMPANTDDVASVVNILGTSSSGSGAKCKFAIRSGGHSPWKGSANINGGVTIDLRHIKSVDVRKNRTIVSVGAGAIWIDVYRALDKLGLAVVGGRVSAVGVGGLTTGGGISFFSGRKGFACDNVVNYEVVLASGKVIQANAKENADLWLALKGGSNNFGIVTRFDLKPFEQGDYWGGVIRYNDSAAPQLVKAFAELNRDVDYDEYAALIQIFYYTPEMGYFVSCNLEYTKAEANPVVFQSYTSIQPQIYNSMRISNTSGLVDEVAGDSPNGLRQLWLTSTFQNDVKFLEFVYNKYKEVTSELISTFDVLPFIILQPISPAMRSKPSYTDGNMLGIGSEKALVLCLICTTWDAEGDDAQAVRVSKFFHSAIVTEAKARGLLDDWIYLNYADGSQDPIGRYGAVNYEKLKAVSRKYDPTAMFQMQVPGGFKLF